MNIVSLAKRKGWRVGRGPDDDAIHLFEMMLQNQYVSLCDDVTTFAVFLEDDDDVNICTECEHIALNGKPELVELESVPNKTSIRVRVDALLPECDSSMKLCGHKVDPCHIFIDELGSILYVSSQLLVEVVE